MVFHVHNTVDEVSSLVAAIFEWAGEILELQLGQVRWKLLATARRVFLACAALCEIFHISPQI